MSAREAGDTHVKALGRNALIALLFLLPACGQIQGVDPRADGGGGDGPKGDGSKTDGSKVDLAGTDWPRLDLTNPDVRQLDATDTGEPDEPVAPFVVSTDPSADATEVVLDQKMTATFSEAMKPSTLTVTTFTLMQGTHAVAGTVTSAETTATFAPSSNLAAGTTFTATITTGATDAAGNPLAANHAWSFTTSACAQTPVALGAADSFAVLAGSTVANTGPTSVIGDVGASPGTAITGFPPGTVVGFEHAGDATAAQGAADLSAAYDDAAGRTLCQVPIAGDLGGRVLPPGLYASSSSLAIASGDLTLDAQGDANAVFIFQMATTLSTTAGRKVNLSGSAKSINVFWQVGSSATLGAMSALQGTILAAQSITLIAGATLNGRVLARTAAAVLSSNTIVKPTP
jgi:hypothetical protein